MIEIVLGDIYQRLVFIELDHQLHWIHAGMIGELKQIIAIGVSVAVMSPIVLGGLIARFPFHWLPGLAWPWYVPLGTLITVLVGMLSSFVGRPDGRTVGQKASAE